MMKPCNRFELQFPSVSANEAFARAAVACFAAQLDPNLEELNDIKTAVSEAVTNCIVHAYRDTIGLVTIRCRILPDSGKHCYCVYASRRDSHAYVHSHEEILARYGKDMVMCERMPQMMVPQMGNQMYTVKLPDQAATDAFIAFVQQQR